MSSRAGSLDANLLLRLLLKDIPAQHQAVFRLVNQAVEPFAVADIAIVEVVFVLEETTILPDLKLPKLSPVC